MSNLSIYFTVSGVQYSDQFAMRLNVKKDVHYFAYKGLVDTEDVPTAYVGTEDIDPSSNLNIIHLEDSVVQNSIRAFSGSLRWSNADTNYVATKHFMLTDVFGDYKSSEDVPFYWKHVLPSATIEPSSVAILNEDLIEVAKYSYKVVRTNEYNETTGLPVSNSYTDVSVYSNYLNTYNEDTGEAEIYFVRYEVSGTPHYELLNSQRAFAEADWNDIWSVTGLLKPWVKKYILSPGVNNYLITVPRSDTTYSLQLDQVGRVIVNEPLDVSDEEPWFARISNGSFTRIIGQYVYKYSIPEFSSQSFSPLYPYKIKANEQAVRIRGDLLKVDASPLQVDSTFYILDIIIRDKNGNVLYALTTETSKNGDFYTEGGERVYRTIETNNAWVSWDTNGIVGWDQEGGFIHLLKDYPDTYIFEVSYYYEEKFFEYTSLNMNPVFDETYDGQFYVLYVVPTGGNNDNTASQTQSIHYVKVDRSGRIIEGSQTSASGNYDLVPVIQTDNEYIHYSKTAQTTLSSGYSSGVTSIQTSVTGASDFPESGVLFIGDEDVTDSSAVVVSYTAVTVGGSSATFTLGSGLSAAVTSGTTVRLYSFKDLLSSESSSNNMQWLILAEVHISANSKIKDLMTIDLRRSGGVIKEKHYQDAVDIDPRAVWARVGTIETRGQPIPGDSAAVIRIPYTLLADYGGTFTTEDIDSIVSKHIAAGVIPVVIYHGAIPEISSASPAANTVNVCWYSEGSNYSYNVYQSYSKDGPWTLLNSTPIADQVYGNCYTVTGLTTNRIYYFVVTSVDTNSIESPRSIPWGVRTRS